MKKKQQGFFAIVAVILILVIGLMGTVIAYLFVSRASLSALQLNGLRAFYIAESGLEIGARLLTMPNLSGTPSRLTCINITGNANVTNASLGNGTFTLTGTMSSNTSNLTAALTANATSLTLGSAINFPSIGRVRVDREDIDYVGKSGNSLIGLTRGVNGTLASSHTSGTNAWQYQCIVDSKAGVPNLTSPTALREIKFNSQLESAFAVGIALSGSSWNIAEWNYPTTPNTWTQIALTGSTQQLNDVSMVSKADIWAVGNGSVGLHYNGTAWTPTTGLANNVMTVYGVSSREAWAGTSGGNIYRWTGGTTWALSFNGPDVINGISMLDLNGDGIADIGWAVGTKKKALLYNGTTWTMTNAGINFDLQAVSTVSANEAWAVGASGYMYYWNGTVWAQTRPTTNLLMSISMERYGTATIGWTVGANSTALYYNGSAWVSQTAGLAAALTLNEVVTISPTEAWCVSSNGRIYRWNGSTWSLVYTSAKGLISIDALHPKIQPVSGWQQVFS